MRFIMMAITHDPEVGTFGDCFRCCIASLLDLDALQVPHFLETGMLNQAQLNTFLGDLGLAYIEVGWNDTSYKQWLGFQAEQADTPIFTVITGKSPRGRFNHSVVARNGKTVHDPHPSMAGLDGPLVDVDGISLGCYAIGFLIPKLRDGDREGA